MYTDITQKEKKLKVGKKSFKSITICGRIYYTVGIHVLYI